MIPSWELSKVSDSMFTDTDTFLYFLDTSIYVTTRSSKTSHPRYVPGSPCCSPWTPRVAPFPGSLTPAHWRKLCPPVDTRHQPFWGFLQNAVCSDSPTWIPHLPTACINSSENIYIHVFSLLKTTESYIYLLNEIMIRLLKANLWLPGF